MTIFQAFFYIGQKNQLLLLYQNGLENYLRFFDYPKKNSTNISEIFSFKKSYIFSNRNFSNFFLIKNSYLSTLLQVFVYLAFFRVKKLNISFDTSIPANLQKLSLCGFRSSMLKFMSHSRLTNVDV